MPPAEPPVAATSRRYLVIAFSDLCDSTGIAAGLEPEIYARLLGQLRQLGEDTVARHGGAVIRIDGDGMLSIYGHPAHHEDLGRRAIEAAADLHAAVRTLDGQIPGLHRPVRMHSGIHSGVVLLREGDIVRGRFEVLGDATNMAARLCERAGEDAIIVSEEALGADRSLFSTGPRIGVRQGNGRAPLAAYEIHGREAAATRFAARMRRGVAAFSGRAGPLRELDSWLHGGPGTPAVAMIVGTAGIGKSRLASEFLDRAEASGVRTVSGYCEAYLAGQPMQPFAQIARALAPGAAGTALPTDQLTELPDAVRRCCDQGQLLIFIDDWQWADDASRQLLEDIQTAGGTNVRILLASRELDIRPQAQTIELSMLPLDDASVAINSLLSGADPFVVDRIWDYAGGNPLFIEELCHAWLADRQAIFRADRSNWLDMIVKARFDRLPAEQAEWVKLAAAIGHILPLWLIQTLTDGAITPEALRALEAADFIYSGALPGTLRFKHGITRDAVYRVIALDQREALHRRIAQALADQAHATGSALPSEALAYHCAAFQDHEQALHHGLVAANAALKASALDRAQSLYRNAADALERLDATAERLEQATELTQKYGLSSIFDPSPDQLTVLERLSAHATRHGHEQGQMLARFWLGGICYGLGRSRESVRHLEQALGVAGRLAHPRLYNQILANLGQAHLAAGQIDEAARILDAAIAAMSAAGQDDRHSGLPYALCCRAFLLADQGDFSGAGALYDRAFAILGGAEPPIYGSMITQLAAVAIWQEDMPAAIRHASRGMALGERTRSRYFAVMSRALRGYARWRRDPGDEAAINDLMVPAQWFRSGASQQRCSLVFGWLAEIMAARGDADQARLHAAHCFRRARAGDRLGEATAARALARLAANGHGHRTASHYLRMAEQAAAIRQSQREAALNERCAAELADSVKAGRSPSATRSAG